jgi:HEAT repeat protein
MLGKLKSKEAVGALIDATEDKDISFSAAISLGEIGDRRAIPALEKMLTKSPRERLSAAYGLAAMGEVSGFDVLSQIALTDTQWGFRDQAVEALGKFGKQNIVPTLMNALLDDHSNVRISAARALGKIGNPEAIPALSAALDDKEENEFHSPRTTVADEAKKAIELINSNSY